MISVRNAILVAIFGTLLPFAAVTAILLWQPSAELAQQTGFWLWTLGAACSAVLGAALVFLLGRKIAAPLAQLAEAAPAVQEGHAPRVDTQIVELAKLRDALSEAALTHQVAMRLSLLNGLVRHAPVGIALFDRELRYVLLNERAAVNDGISIEEHLGKTVTQVLGENAFAEKTERMLRTVRDSGTSRTLEEIGGAALPARSPQCWWFAEYFPLKDAQGAVTHIAALALDITERKLAEDKLRQADERKDVYLATLAHELRNPLAPIRNAVAILRRTKTADPTLGWARDVIDRQVTQMSRLLDELLDLSRATRGKLQLSREVMDLGEALQDATETTMPQFDANAHHLNLEVPSRPVWVDGDRMRLSQVFVNLLTNAAKYTDSGGHIDVKLSDDGGQASIVIADNGIGIESDLLARIFEPFAQSTRSLHRAQGGLGIGLALVRGIVELHGGAVTVRSKGGEGSTFEVRLPMCAAPFEEKSEPAQPAPMSIAGLHVLVVDDNRDAAESLQRLLRSAGARAEVAFDGGSALELVYNEMPDAMVLDIGMPGLTGYDVAHAISALPLRPFMIALTGWGQDRDRESALKAGFNRHFTKPVDPDHLLKILGTLRSADATEAA